jgi:WD40 repeat protein
MVMPTSTGIIGYQQVGASSSPVTFPTQGAGIVDAKISTDSNFAVGVNTFPPYAVCYKRSGATTFVDAGSNLTSIHNYSSTCCDFSIGGNYLAIGGNALYLYKKNMATFTALTSPVSELVQAVRFSADSTVLYVGTSSGVVILNRVGDTFTQASWTISGNVQGIDLYSKYLAVTTDQDLTVYDTTTQTAVYTYSTTTLKSVRFSTDGLHIAVEHTSAPYYEVKQWQQS